MGLSIPQLLLALAREESSWAWAVRQMGMRRSRPNELILYRKVRRPFADAPFPLLYASWLEIVWSIDPERDAAELARLSLPANLTGDPTNDRTRASVHPFSTTYLLPADAEAYATVGFSIKEHGTLDSPKWPHLNTTWARRLQGHRRLSYLIAQAT